MKELVKTNAEYLLHQSQCIRIHDGVMIKNNHFQLHFELLIFSFVLFFVYSIVENFIFHQTILYLI